MSTVPQPYDRQASFTGFSTPERPTVGQDLEAELNALNTSLDETQARLVEIQRDDGMLANESVHPNALSKAVRAILATRNGTIKGDWLAATEYEVGDVVVGPDGLTWICAAEHVSDDFDVDVAAVRWVAISGGSGGGGGPIGIGDVTGLASALAGKAPVDAFYALASADGDLANGAVVTGASGQISVNLVGAPGSYQLALGLANTGVTAGTYNSANVTVDATGRITAIAEGAGGGGSGGPGTWIINRFTAFAGQSGFALSANPGGTNAVIVDIDGVIQKATVDYVVSGSNLNLTSALEAGQVVQVRWGATVPIGTTSAEAVSYLPTFSGAVQRSVRDRLSDCYNVRDYGALGNGSGNDAPAIQAAIDAAEARGGGIVYLPTGTYVLTAGVVVGASRVHIVGDGPYATQIVFAPTANGTAILVENPGQIVYQGSIRDLSLFSFDSTYTKTAIRIIDGSFYLVENVVIGGSVVAGGSSFWSGGAGSIGLQTNGRDSFTARRIMFYADRPIVISGNPNFTLDCDHFHFQDTYIGANGNPNFEVVAGVYISGLAIDGYNAWVIGTAGFSWVDPTTTEASHNLRLSNIRCEQGTSASAYCIDIQPSNSIIRGVTIENFYGGVERNGIRLRNAYNVTLSNSVLSGGAGRTLIDADGTVYGLSFANCFWLENGTATLTDQRLVWSGPKRATAAPLPSNALYESINTGDRGWKLEGPITGYELTLNNNTVASLGTNVTSGLFLITDSEYVSAIYSLLGTNQAVSEVSDPSGIFTPTAGSATSTNIYWSAANSRYEIQNLRGAQRRYKITHIGNIGSF